MNWHQACELPYYHGSDLGANPTAEGATFKLWAPTACGVVVCLYATGTDAEPGAKELGVHEMRRGDGGVWAIVLPGNLHGTYYIYRICFPDGLQRTEMFCQQCRRLVADVANAKAKQQLVQIVLF